MIHIFEDSENYAPLPTQTVEGAPTPALRAPQTDRLQLAPGQSPKLSMIAIVWNGDCRDCGAGYPASCCKGSRKYENNCAHFLSDALVRCGFVELLSDGALYKCDKADCQCPSERRPIRARELWEWFKRKATTKHERVRWDKLPRNSGWWAVFQINEAEYYGGHVVVIDTENWEYYGTCSYPAWDQYAYQW